MKHFESYLYSKLSAYDPMVRILDKEDVMQEIRFAMLTAEQGELFRVASGLIRKLARNCGYSRRKGKDNFEAFYRELAIPYDPAQDTTLPQSRAYYVEDYYKTTMRGHGRDRNLTHVVEGEYDVVLEGTTRSRSGRFGNSFKLLIADELKIEEEGVA